METGHSLEKNALFLFYFLRLQTVMYTLRQTIIEHEKESLDQALAYQIHCSTNKENKQDGPKRMENKQPVFLKPSTLQ